jgi:hypothetical protein
MFKGYIAVILLHLLLIKENKAKEDDIKMIERQDYSIMLDTAIGSCAQRPTIRSKLFLANPPVSQ